MDEGGTTVQRNLSRLWRVLAVGASLTLALAACGGDDGGDGGDGGGGDGETIQLGFMGALTGPNAQLGINIQQGAQLAIQQYNEDAETQVELVDYDTTGSPDQAPQLARQAIEDEVVGVIGPAFSGESRTAVPLLEEAQVPNVSASATAASLAEEGWEYWHRVVADDAAQGPAVAQYLQEALGVQTVAVTDENSEYGLGLADEVAAALEAAGVTVAVRESIDPEAADYSSTVNNIAGANVDAVYHGGYYAEASKLVQQLRDGGVQATFVSSDGSLDPQLVEQAGDAAEGAVISCPCNLASADAEDPELAEFAEAYEAEFGAPGTYSSEGYDAATLFLNAISEGNTDSASINEYLAGASLEGVSKPISFNEQGALAEALIYMHEIQDGQIVSLGVLEDAIAAAG